MNDHVVDPLPRAAAIAEKARRLRKSTSLDDDEDDDDDNEDDEQSEEDAEDRKKSRKRKGTYLEKKKSAKRLGFNSDDEGEIVEDPDDQEEKAVLKSPKKMSKAAASPSPGRKLRKSQMKKYEGRRTWTDAEVGAIKQGIAEFGWGKWAQIKEHYKAILKDRTSGQIKVCCRTLAREHARVRFI